MSSTDSMPEAATKLRGVVVSPIVVNYEDGNWVTLDLWARDINMQAKSMSLVLACPVGQLRDKNNAALSPEIQIVRYGDIAALQEAISNATFVQIPGNSGWRGARSARAALRLARQSRKPVFLGVSSNRAKTAWLNSRGSGWLRRVRAALQYCDIRLTQSWLAAFSDGVFVVGAGLVDLISRVNGNIHVSTASWIAEEDIVERGVQSAPSRLRICMAGRYERMKGFHIGLAAVQMLSHKLDPMVTLIGQGPESHALVAQAKQSTFDVKFLEPVTYPSEFFAVIDQQDLVLLTNLNDEQPRLLFDALCRGALPVCPDSEAYKALGLDPRLLYRKGDAVSLAEAIAALADPSVKADVMDRTKPILQRFTLESMHKERFGWITATVSRRQPPN